MIRNHNLGNTKEALITMFISRPRGKVNFVVISEIQVAEYFLKTELLVNEVAPQFTVLSFLFDGMYYIYLHSIIRH